MIVYAPWTADEVAALKRWQHSPAVHPYTCTQRMAHLKDVVLVPTIQGWVCPVRDCKYTQSWCREESFNAPDELLDEPLLHWKNQ